MMGTLFSSYQVVIPAKAGTSIPEAVAIESRSRGVLDRPHARAMTATYVTAAVRPPAQLTPAARHD
jgi:hypothetical protein